MLELFSIRSNQFSSFDWHTKPFKGYKGALIKEGVIRSVSGGFGDFLFQGRPGKLVSTWNNDYVIQKKFEAHAGLDQQLIEASLIMTGRLEHSDHSGKWSMQNKFTTNFNYATCMDHRTRFEAGVHYTSFDVHMDISIVQDLLPEMPELVSPFLTSYENRQPYNLFDEGTIATEEIITLFVCLRKIRTYGDASDTITQDFTRMLVKQLFLYKAAMSERRGLTQSQMEDAAAINQVALLIRQEKGPFKGISFYAQQARMSCTRFKNNFNLYIGMPPGKYSMESRIEAAQSRLLFSQDKLDDIAKEVGYSDHRSLHKAIKSRLGASPSNIRRLS
ncbi:Helix-turn-helix domain-containing protein [Arachidicoccus rhizosphaerae]|uniref:Helix-turn-helix domain-containing protein n=1 Tax=Arachidicoccus rhizosphaerae TaxID=551991 RepID=A0A1H4AAU9_9BACT|nr:helix-turn-helix domain-containing protein [Arachidicoccus rhizosphaerae]SEA33016.1 Helix-turn-helix domain-containing protein [Arachidicoccus rhizosphaerae]